MEQYTIQEVELLMNTNINHGLTSKEANKRLKQDGMNELTERKKKSIAEVFFEQFKDPMVVILMLGALLSVIMKEFLDAFIIFLVVILNGSIGTFQVMKSEKALEALKKMMQPVCKVMRDGQVHLCSTREIVVGDMIEFEAGDCIPCDIRLTSSTMLMMDESLLSGESESVTKNEYFRGKENMPISDRHNMVFMSTYVASGKGKGIAVQIGMQSEVGKIASLLNEHQEASTPLQLRMNQLGKVLGIYSVILCAIMMGVGVHHGKNFWEMLLLAISLAVAAIPEGLPAVVTIVQALGVSVMSKHNSIVRKLSAVETLGSVNVICSDKTGTLTQNKMSVVSTCFDHVFNQPLSEIVLVAMASCQDVKISHDQWIGDSSEKAFLEYVMKHRSFSEIFCEYLRIDEIPFDSNRKKMSTVHQKDDHQFVFTKGSLEHILRQCTQLMIHGRKVTLNEYEKKRVLEEASIMEKQALRVFGFCMKESSLQNMDYEKDATFLGIVGLKDPIKEDVKEAIAQCEKAGIEVVMITGDSLNTAYAIGKECGIVRDDSQIMQGQDIDALSDSELINRLKKVRIFARVSPTHKMRLVDCLQSMNKIVAMSGDGVNDAPALKKADIGIAMGQQGSDVCKSVSDIILLDDRFSTIVKAIEAGRNIYLKIQKSVFYLLSCNLGEIMSLFFSSVFLANEVVALCAIQILWTNLVTDAFPALSLGMEADEKNVMEKAPRDKKESLFAHGGLVFIVLNGMYIGVITLVAFKTGLKFDDRTAQTMAFMVLSLSQMFHSLNCRQIHRSMFGIGFFENPWLLLVVTCGIILQIFACQLPFMNMLLKTAPLNLFQWGVVFSLSMSIMVINEISKLFNHE